MTQRHEKRLETPDLIVRPSGNFAGERLERHAEEVVGRPEAGNTELVTRNSPHTAKVTYESNESGAPGLKFA